MRVNSLVKPAQKSTTQRKAPSIAHPFLLATGLKLIRRILRFVAPENTATGAEQDVRGVPMAIYAHSKAVMAITGRTVAQRVASAKKESRLSALQENTAFSRARQRFLSVKTVHLATTASRELPTSRKCLALKAVTVKLVRLSSPARLVHLTMIFMAKVLLTVRLAQLVTAVVKSQMVAQSALRDTSALVVPHPLVQSAQLVHMETHRRERETSTSVCLALQAITVLRARRAPRRHLLAFTPR